MSNEHLGTFRKFISVRTKMSSKLLEEQLLIKYKNLHLSKAKLKQTSHTSALLSGFAMVALVEVQLNHTGPQWLLILFAVVTSLLVSVHLIAVMISTCILPHIEAIAQSADPKAIDDSPHERLKYYIELAWACSTTVGLILFLVDIAIIVWVKFLEYSWWASFSATVLMVPILIIFVGFAWHFYWSLGAHSYVVTSRKLLVLEDYMREIQEGQAYVSGSAVSLQMAGAGNSADGILPALRERRFAGSSMKKYPPRISEGDIEAGLLWAAGDAVKRNQILLDTDRGRSPRLGEGPFSENSLRNIHRMPDNNSFADSRYPTQLPKSYINLNSGEEVNNSRISPFTNSSWYAVNERWLRSSSAQETPPNAEAASSESRRALNGARMKKDGMQTVDSGDGIDEPMFGVERSLS